MAEDTERALKKDASYYSNWVEENPEYFWEVPQKYRSAKLCKMAISRMGFQSVAEYIKKNPDRFSYLHQSLFDHDVLLEYIKSSILFITISRTVYMRLNSLLNAAEQLFRLRLRQEIDQLRPSINTLHVTDLHLLIN